MARRPRVRNRLQREHSFDSPHDPNVGAYIFAARRPHKIIPKGGHAFVKPANNAPRLVFPTTPRHLQERGADPCRALPCCADEHPWLNPATAVAASPAVGRTIDWTRFFFCVTPVPVGLCRVSAISTGRSTRSVMPKPRRPARRCAPPPTSPT